MRFGEIVRETMNARGMKARELAEKSGTNEAYISRILSGKVNDPTFVKAVAIITALDADIDDFASRCDNERVEYAYVTLPKDGD